VGDKNDNLDIHHFIVRLEKSNNNELETQINVLLHIKKQLFTFLIHL